MPSLPISLLPLVTSGDSDSLMVIVVSGVTSSIYFSALTEQFNTYSVTGITSNTVLTWSYNYYGVNNSTSITLTLPDTTNRDGQYLVIKDEVGTCSINSITINPNTIGVLIDGQNSVVMNINNMSLTFMVRNGNWFLI